MKTGDFIQCTFQGDTKKYVADITGVQDDSFDCRFVHSGKLYTFDSHSFTVLETNGGFPRGTPLTWYQLFTPGSGDLTPFCFVVVTFGDNIRYLGVLNYLTPDRNVTFLHSGNMYTFNDNNEVVSKTGGIYDIGHQIQGMELYVAGDEVQGHAARADAFGVEGRDGVCQRGVVAGNVQGSRQWHLGARHTCPPDEQRAGEQEHRDH